MVGAELRTKCMIRHSLYRPLLNGYGFLFYMYTRMYIEDVFVISERDRTAVAAAAAARRTKGTPPKGSTRGCTLVKYSSTEEANHSAADHQMKSRVAAPPAHSVARLARPQRATNSGTVFQASGCPLFKGLKPHSFSLRSPLHSSAREALATK